MEHFEAGVVIQTIAVMWGICAGISMFSAATSALFYDWDNDGRFKKVEKGADLIAGFLAICGMGAVLWGMF